MVYMDESQKEMWEELGMLLEEWRVLEDKLKAFKDKWKVPYPVIEEGSRYVSENAR